MGLLVGNAEVTGLRLGSQAVTKVMLGSEQVWSAEPVWSPLDLGDALLRWYDAEDASSLTHQDGLISAWADKKTGLILNHHISSSHPAFSASGFAGRPMLVFDGVDDNLSGSAEGLPIDGDEGTILAIVDQMALPGDSSQLRCVTGYGSTSTRSRRLRRTVVTGVNRPNTATGNGDSLGSVSGDGDLSGRHVLRGLINATSRQSAMDRAPYVPQGTSPMTDPGTLAVGRPGDSSVQFWHGGVNAVLYLGALTPEQDAKVLEWAMARIS